MGYVLAAIGLLIGVVIGLVFGALIVVVALQSIGD
jgi:hypothetical protein